MKAAVHASSFQALKSIVRTVLFLLSLIALVLAVKVSAQEEAKGKLIDRYGYFPN